MSTENALVRKLQGYSAFGAADVALLVRTCAGARVVEAHTDLIREGDEPGPVFIVLDGWACRYKLMRKGERQITAFLLPGDFCDVHIALLKQMDHSISTLTRARIATVSRTWIEELVETRPCIMRALRWAQLVDQSISRTWITSLGRRDAIQRVAHLLSELWQRAAAVGLVVDNILLLPLTQREIADALGLSSIHVNRVLQQLRHERLIWLGPRRAFSVLHVERLAERAGFEPGYLHRTPCGD